MCVRPHAQDVGLEGSELPDAFASDTGLIERLREVRGKAAQLIGFCDDWHDVDRQSPGLPLLVALSEPKTYRTMRGKTIEPDAADMRARLVWYNKCHESMAGTGSMCTAAAIAATRLGRKPGDWGTSPPPRTSYGSDTPWA